MRGAKERKKSGWVVALILVSIMTVSVISVFVIKGLTHKPAHTENPFALTADTQKSYTLLITGRDKAASLSDVMMLVSFDVDDGEICVIQIPRDTYFNYTDKAYKKINGAPAAYKSQNAFALALGEALGVPIDFYASIDICAFVDIVDLLGGVEINVPFDMEYNDPYQDLTVKLKEGKQTLDGAGAIQFVRYRAGYIRGDVSRMDAQKMFLSSLAEKIAEIRNPMTLCNIASKVGSNTETNLTEWDVLYFARRFMQCESEDITLVTAPGEDIQSSISGAWYYILSRDAMRELLAEHFGRERYSNFDENMKFVDKNVKSFYDIYNKYCPYRIYRADEISRDGIELK